MTVRLAGTRAVMSALMAKGVDRETAEAAIGPGDGDEARALELASARAARLRGLRPDVAHRRLSGFLMRRGHAPNVARAAASRALGLDSEG